MRPSMTIKNLKNLMICFSAIFWVGCSSTKVIWTDLREEKHDFTLELSFENVETKKETNCKLRANKTKEISSLKNMEWTGSEHPSKYTVSFALNIDNSIIQIILMDNPKGMKSLSYDSVLPKKKESLFYGLFFYDKKRNRTVWLYSKDNVFNINPDYIEVNLNTDFRNYIKELTDNKDTGYYINGSIYGSDENFCAFVYYIQSSFSDTFLHASPNYDDGIDAYLYPLSSIK